MPRHNGYATFDFTGTYRYELGGNIGPVEPLLVGARVVKLILWILLNPSVANDEKDDPTLRTIVSFSERWGYNQILVGNLYAYVTSKVKTLKKAMATGVDVVGPENNQRLMEMVRRVRKLDGRVMAGWGANGKPDRVREVVDIAGELYCLKVNGDGSPVHPLYQPHRLVPSVWTGEPPAPPSSPWAETFEVGR